MTTAIEHTNSVRTVATVAELLQRAKESIDKGVASLRGAAEDIAEAIERGTSHRDIAATLGRSVGWVHALNKWRDGDFSGTPFGPASRMARHRRKDVQATEQLRSAKSKQMEVVGLKIITSTGPGISLSKEVICITSSPSDMPSKPVRYALEGPTAEDNGLDIPYFLDRRPLSEDDDRRLNELERAWQTFSLAWNSDPDRVRSGFAARHNVPVSTLLKEIVATQQGLEKQAWSVAVEEARA